MFRATHPSGLRSLLGVPVPGSLITVVVLAWVAAGCGETGVLDSAGPLQIQVTADRLQAGVDQEVEFTVEARGAGLHMLVLRFGDGASEVEAFEQPVYSQLGMTKRHAYAEGGTYEVSAYVHNATAEVAADTIRVVITGGT